MIMQVMLVSVLWYIIIRVAVMQFREYREEYEARRSKKLKRKKTEYMAKAWENIACSYDPITEPEKRGLAVARAMNLQHELIEMAKNE